MNFNFNDAAGITNNTANKSLQPNMIHTVTFDGCEALDGVEFKNGTKGNILDIKFSNESGSYSHRVFEPTAKDAEDRDSQFGKNPSNLKAMMLLFKHLIDATNPELGKQIDVDPTKIQAANWKAMRNLMIEATKNFVGKETKIKLIANKDGYAAFPFFASYNKEGKLYMSSYFIGDNIYFSTKEQTKIQKAANATPTPANNDFVLDAPASAQSQDNSDLDFNL